MPQTITAPTWPIWVCGGITAGAAVITAIVALVGLSATHATQFTVAATIPMAIIALFALADRGGSAVATAATLMALVLTGHSIVYGIAGNWVAAAAFGLMALLTAFSFVKMVRTCAIG